MVKLFRYCCLLALVFSSAAARSEVTLSARHIYVFFPGIDAVWGSYLFLVTNSGSTPERLKFPIMLPAEMVDFQGQENISPDELKLDAQEGLTIDKVFPPGDFMVNVGFKVPARLGEAKLTLKAKSGFDSLGLFVWQDTMAVTSDHALDVRKGVPFSGRSYDTFTLTQGKAGETYTMQLTGIPEGRGRLWIIGGILGGLLLLAGGSLAYFSRTRLPQNEEII